MALTLQNVFGMGVLIDGSNINVKFCVLNILK